MNNIQFEDLVGHAIKFDDKGNATDFAVKFIFKCLTCNKKFETPLYEDDEEADKIMKNLENKVWSNEMLCPHCNTNFSCN